MTYFIDTNVVIDMLDGDSNILSSFKQAFLYDIVRIPDIVYYETLRGFEYSDTKHRMSVFEEFAEVCGIEYMKLNVFRRAAKIFADLKKQGIKIDDSDLLIGALALENNAVVVTNNTRHFQYIDGLKLVNLKKL